MRLFPSMLTAAAVLLPASQAFALQPLEDFLASAHAKNPDSLTAEASVKQREAEAAQGRGRLLPSFTARGTYTRNQYEAVANFQGVSLTIIPQDQLDAFFILDVPLLDLAQWARYGGQKVAAQAAAANQAVTRRTLDERVIRAYNTFAVTAGLVETAKKSIDVAEKNRGSVEDRVAAAVATELDKERAIANVERAKQDLADAELSQNLAARALLSLTRLTPTAVTGYAEDDLHAEGPLAQWIGEASDKLPERRLADANRRLAEAQHDAAKMAFVPVLSAQAQERVTNATGFTGRVASYTLTANATFRFDFGLIPAMDAQRASAQAAVAGADAVRQNTEDAIAEAWYRVGAGIAKARAARAQAKAAEHAAQIAQERYAAGASTQLDVTQAQRDSFSANVARAQADLDLTVSRYVLRLASGKPLPSRSSGESR